MLKSTWTCRILSWTRALLLAKVTPLLNILSLWYDVSHGQKAKVLEGCKLPKPCDLQFLFESLMFEFGSVCRSQASSAWICCAKWFAHSKSEHCWALCCPLLQSKSYGFFVCGCGCCHTRLSSLTECLLHVAYILFILSTVVCLRWNLTKCLWTMHLLMCLKCLSRRL